jgi:hypothetical protein
MMLFVLPEYTGALTRSTHVTTQCECMLDRHDIGMRHPPQKLMIRMLQASCMLDSIRGNMFDTVLQNLPAHDSSKLVCEPEEIQIELIGTTTGLYGTLMHRPVFG